MCSQLVVAVIMEPLHGCLLDRAVHPLDLTIRPRMVWLGQSVFDPVGLADHIETHWSGMDGISVSGLFSELDAPRPRQIDLNQWRPSGALSYSPIFGQIFA